jgi:hypothetical protein
VTTFRYIIAVVSITVASVSTAYAEAWMVKISGVLGCRERVALEALSADGTSRSPLPPAGCVALDLGERLLYQPEVGVGFDDYMRLQRRDGSMLFVRSSAVVRDPGFGSISEDRAGE